MMRIRGGRKRQASAVGDVAKNRFQRFRQGAHGRHPNAIAANRWQQKCPARRARLPGRARTDAMQSASAKGSARGNSFAPRDWTKEGTAAELQAQNTAR